LRIALKPSFYSYKTLYFSFIAVIFSPLANV